MRRFGNQSCGMMKWFGVPAWIGPFALLMATVILPPGASAADFGKPNVIFILADDLGYGDLGCYGQKRIATPHLDQLAAEGLRFTQFYAGSTVCAPSRSCLMTGQHTGHTRIRGYGGVSGRVPLEPGDVTIPEIIRGSHYSTALVGKWGLGEQDTTGLPTRQGFEYFFGYLTQSHAHNYYPDHLWRNEERVEFPGNVVVKGVAKERDVYSHDLLTREALEAIDRLQYGPFFLYLAYTIPHANNEAGKEGMEVPDDKPYSDKDWPQQEKNKAAMITRMDADVGRIVERLAALGIAEKTLIMFSSDNGPHREGGGDPAFFDSNGPLRGIKRDLYEGGIRVPTIARWKGRIKPGQVSDQVGAFWDILPTVAELAGVTPPADIDGISLVPTLLGEDAAGHPQAKHEFLYWEFHERGLSQAVRMGDWKAVRKGLKAPLELYNLADDLGEEHNVADQHPDIVRRIEEYLKTARTESTEWPIRESGSL